MSISEEREKRQIKVFKKWINSHLSKKGRSVDKLEDDFDDGVNLCYLYEIISGEKVGKIIEKPKTQLQRTQNLALACNPINKFVKEIGIGLQYGPSQIENGDARAILGLIWILITKFVLPESEEDKNRKRALLKWVQKVTEPYDNVNVKNFTRSWNDGLAFNALLHQYDNDLIDYDSLTKDDATGNCKNAFDVAEKIGITRLLDEEDVADQERPDEKSIVMQVALYYQHFHKNLERKLAKEAEQYRASTEKLLKWIEKKKEKYSNTDFSENTLEELREMEDVDLPKFLEQKQKYADFKSKIMVQLASIQRQQKKEKIKIYIPEDDYSLTNTHTKWLELNDTVVNYSAAIRDHIMEIEEEKMKKQDEEERAKEEEELAEQEKKKQEIEDELKRIQEELDRRMKEQEEIMAKIEEERKKREEERQQRKDEYEERKAKDNEERNKIHEYDQKASEVLLWLFDQQKELTKMGEKEQDEEKEEELPDEESTDEETKNKRKEAVEEGDKKTQEVLGEFNNLSENHQHGASCSGKEMSNANACFSYVLVGKESEELKEIKNSEDPEDDEE